MSRDTHKSMDALSKKIQEIVNEKLPALTVDGVEVRDGFDHDDEPVIYIDVYYRLSDRPIDPNETLGTLVTLRDDLWRSGEDRFPHLRHHLDEHQKVKGLR